MKKKGIYTLAVVLIIVIIIGVSSVYVIRPKEEKNEHTLVAENVNNEETTKSLTVNPDDWDTNRVTAVTSEDNIVVPVPVGFTASPAENERYVNGNVTKKGTLSNLTFTSAGDYPWTQNSDNIWVSGNKQVASSTSELVSNEFTVGANGGWVEVEWSVCSGSLTILSMTVNDTVNGTSEQLPKAIQGTLYGTTENRLIYTKCGTELSQGNYTISIKYTRDTWMSTALDSGYVKIGTFINYDENGVDELEIHKTGGFVIYEGTETINDLWIASKERNQFVWVPVNDTSRIYERNTTTGKIKAKLWGFEATGRTARSNGNIDTKEEAGVLNNPYNASQDYDRIKYFSGNYNITGYTKDTFYKEFETEYMNTIKSIEKYGGFYIGRYETGSISSNIPIVRRMNQDIGGQNWYTMYTKMKNISNNPNIQTSMIWGSLWDETLEWIIGTGDKARVEVSTNSISWGNYRGASFTYTDTSGTMTTKNADYGQLVPTGSTERNLANNIYDLAGNAYELTLERQSNVFCVCRGGWSQYYGDRDFASKRETYVTNGLMNRFYSYPENSNSTVGFRAYLYVK